MQSVTLRYRPHIDGLRGVAVLAVILYHAFPKVAPGGFIGVDIFFVISGFLISSILYADFGAPASKVGSVIMNFYGRRVRRIFPALIIVLVASYVLGYALLLPGEFEKLAADIVASVGFYLNFVLSGRENYFGGAAISQPLLHLWSLGVEEQFYLFWPLAIWLAVRCRIRILPVAVFLAACSFFWYAENKSDAAAGFYLPQMRLWELMVGAIAAALFPLIPKVPIGLEAGNKVPTSIASEHGRFPRESVVANILSIVGIALIGLGLVIIKREFGGPGKWMLLPTVGSACVVCSGGSAWTNRHILSNRILVWIGLISYPFYLWHWPLLSFAQIGSTFASSPLLRISVIAASGFLAWLTYGFVEAPIRRGRRFGRTAAALAGGMAAIACVGYFTKRANGFPSRFPALINEISTYQYDPAAAVRQGTYFLIGDQDETRFKQDPNEILRSKPTLYLWGDSHAAALYPGLSDVYGKKYNIVQRTAARTPPFMPECFNPGNRQQINRYVFDSIVRDRPECVVLEAEWQAYEWERIETTIVALKAAGIHHVVLVGPVPQWFGSLPQQLLNYVARHRSRAVPMRMTSGADPMPAQVDKSMYALSDRLGAEYISPCQILGNEEGYLVRTGDTAESVMTYDYSHLTASGSRYLVSHFPEL
jgi:peptidoglycan/LPS O-acetylase OafA/YrhL